MRRDDLELLLKRKPCPRLRLHLTNGFVFEITDSETVVLGRDTVELLAPLAETREREAVINLIHIIWVEVLPPA